MAEPLEEIMKSYIERDQWSLYKDRYAHWRNIIGQMTLDEALTKLPTWETTLGLSTLMNILIAEELEKGYMDYV